MYPLRLKTSLLIIVITTVSVQLSFIEKVDAQAIAGSTAARLGNATAYPTSNFANNPLSIVDPGIGSATRHGHRQSSTGIGGSYLGTESVTSESAPATTPMYAPISRNPATSPTNSYNYYESHQISPALNSVARNSQLFSSDPAPSFEQGGGFSTPTTTGLDALPSFNRNSVIQGYSHGGKSWLGL